MKFTCDKCQSQYHIDDSKVGERGVKVRCKRCGNIIIVRREDQQPEHDTVILNMNQGAAAEEQRDTAQVQLEGVAGEAPQPEAHQEAGHDRSTTRVFNFEEMQIVLREQRAAHVTGSEPAESVAEEWEESTEMVPSAAPQPGVAAAAQQIQAAAPAPQEKVWYVAVNNEQVGPLAVVDIEERWKLGEIGEETLAWKPGMADWKDIAGIPELQFLVRVPTKELRKRIGLISLADIGYKQDAQAKVQAQAQAQARQMLDYAPRQAQSEPAAPAAPVAQSPEPSSIQSDIGMRLDTGTVDWKPSAAAALATLVRAEEEMAKEAQQAEAKPDEVIMTFPPPSEPMLEQAQEHARSALRAERRIERPEPESPRRAVRERRRPRRADLETDPERERPAIPEKRKKMLIVAAIMVATFTGSAIIMKVIGPPPPKQNTENVGEEQPGAAEEPGAQESGEEPAKEKETAEGEKAPEQTAGQVKPQEEAPAQTEEKPAEEQAAAEEKKPLPKTAQQPPAAKGKKERHPKPPKKDKKPAAFAMKAKKPKEEPPLPQVIKGQPAMAKTAPPPPPFKARANEDEDFLLEDEKPAPPAKAASSKSQVVVEKGLPQPPQPATKPAPPSKRDDLLAFDKEFGDSSSGGGDDLDDLLGSVGTKPKKAEVAKERPAKPEPPSAPPPPPPKSKEAELPKTLTPVEVKNVVMGHLNEIKSCVDAFRSKGGVLQGPIKMYWEIQTNGKTSSVRSTSPEYQNTFLSGCAVEAVKTWNFPKFNGPPIPINFPFKL